MVKGTTETHVSITSVLIAHTNNKKRKKKNKAKARFKRRISAVTNLTRELNACEVRRLNHSTP